jgi:hypothetical protein
VASSCKAYCLHACSSRSKRMWSKRHSLTQRSAESKYYQWSIPEAVLRESRRIYSRHIQRYDTGSISSLELRTHSHLLNLPHLLHKTRNLRVFTAFLTVSWWDLLYTVDSAQGTYRDNQREVRKPDVTCDIFAKHAVTRDCARIQYSQISIDRVV